MEKAYRFEAEILQGDGGGAYVLFPYDVQAEFGLKGRVPVICTIDSQSYNGSLIKYGTPMHALIILKAIREKLHKQVGDTLSITVTRDTSERKHTIPLDISQALGENNLLETFATLSYSHQREHLSWIESAKKQETRESRIIKMIEMIRKKGI